MSVVPMRRNKAGNGVGKAVAKPYEPTEREQRALTAYEARKAKKLPAPKMKVTMTEKEERGTFLCQMAVDHESPELGYMLLMEAVGTGNSAFLKGLLDGAALIGQSSTNVDVNTLNFVLAVVRGIEPKDQMEAMLASQMAAVQLATMKSAAFMNNTTDLQKWETCERSFNRLARTFAAQMESLKRYRSKGEQRVYVERVNVEQGGQAIVGNVGTGDRGRG